MKNLTYIIGAIAFLALVWFVFTPEAHAQFVPCVWPKTCG